jgi:hypothetical protein
MTLKLLAAIVILIATSCTQRSSTAPNVQVSSETDLSSASDSELLKHVSEKVTLHGQFSLRGKVGPYILIRSGPIYLISQDDFSWGDDYVRMEGRDVRVTGILRFAHYAHANEGTAAEARPKDHYYVEAENAKIELNEN